MSTSQQAASGIANLSSETAEYAAPKIVLDQVLQKNWSEEYRRSIESPDKFWGEYAKQFQWSRPWTKVSSFDGTHHQWFLGARTNITINALDRHANSDRRRLRPAR